MCQQPAAQLHKQLYTRTNRYHYSFLPRTIPDWNNLNIENLANCDLDSFKDYLFSSR